MYSTPAFTEIPAVFERIKQVSNPSIVKKVRTYKYDVCLLNEKKQCFGSGIHRIRYFFSDPDPFKRLTDPDQESQICQKLFTFEQNFNKF